MIFKSPYSPHKVVEILKEQIDKYPSFLWSFIPFNIINITYRSDVCGIVKASKFILRNRISPHDSLIAKGKISKDGSGSQIEINYVKPSLVSIFPTKLLNIINLNRFKYDQEIIESFLNEWLDTREINQ
jgi:hypothetical protein